MFSPPIETGALYSPNVTIHNNVFVLEPIYIPRALNRVYLRAHTETRMPWSTQEKLG